jgi:outer membrane lipoprotein SlyB
MTQDDPITDTLKKFGVRVERVEASTMKQMLGSGLGGIIGSAIGAGLGMGWLGRALCSLGGSVAGQVAVTHKVSCGDEGGREPMGFEAR